MVRLARIVVPEVVHHVTQRGNRRQETFFHEVDHQAYLALVGAWCPRCGVEVWSYCLMPNHVHLIVVPSSQDGLRQALGEAHRRYRRRINLRRRWPWSSAAAHVADKDDSLVRVGPLLERVSHWREFLRAGAAAEEAESFGRHERTGRPLGPARFLERIEKTLGRVIRPHKRGPKPKRRKKQVCCPQISTLLGPVDMERRKCSG